MEYISRSIEPTVLEIAKYFPVIVITGPRQSGKTTLIKHLFNEFLQFSMEDLHVREFAEQDPVAFLEQNKLGMIIDEVQRVPSLMSYIQGIVDKDPSKKFILSGSSNFSMLQSVTQSLAGRAAILELLPMSIPEIGDWASSHTLDELIFGGILVPSNSNYTRSVNYYEGNSRLGNGWALLGNPFVCDCYLVDANGNPLTIYKMNAEGTGLDAVESGPIAPFEGFFYYTPTTCNVYFSRTAPSKGGVKD